VSATAKTLELRLSAFGGFAVSNWGGFAVRDWVLVFCLTTAFLAASAEVIGIKVSRRPDRS
jgi:hypothetical protein